MKVTEDTNFCRVFELPSNYPEDYCFQGGIPVTMKMVDWFNPWPVEGFKLINTTWLEVVNILKPWMLEKNYIQPDKTYILITDFGEAMIINKKEYERKE